MTPIVIDGLRYDPETGYFIWEMNRLPSLRGKRGGGRHAARYRQIRFRGARLKEHRLAWFFVHGEWPPRDLDHINCDPLDNRIANLRLATPMQNCANQKRAKNNTSGVKGVSWVGRLQKWKAEIRANGVSMYLGIYSDLESAAEAVRQARASHCGQFARHA